jgi:hypothetical protein
LRNFLRNYVDEEHNMTSKPRRTRKRVYLDEFVSGEDKAPIYSPKWTRKGYKGSIKEAVEEFTGIRCSPPPLPAADETDDYGDDDESGDDNNNSQGKRRERSKSLVSVEYGTDSDEEGGKSLVSEEYGTDSDGEGGKSLVSEEYGTDSDGEGGKSLVSEEYETDDNASDQYIL